MAVKDDPRVLAWDGPTRAFKWALVALVLSFVPGIGFILSMIPPVALTMLEFGPVRAGLLVLLLVVLNSVVDNVIKPYILHGQTNLHPLLALLSVIGGVQVLGPIGILVGPMLVAFLQALVNMLNKEIERMELPSHRRWMIRERFSVLSLCMKSYWAIFCLKSSIKVSLAIRINFA